MKKALLTIFYFGLGYAIASSVIASVLATRQKKAELTESQQGPQTLHL